MRWSIWHIRHFAPVPSPSERIVSRIQGSGSSWHRARIMEQTGQYPNSHMEGCRLCRASTYPRSGLAGLLVALTESLQFAAFAIRAVGAVVHREHCPSNHTHDAYFSTIGQSVKSLQWNALQHHLPCLHNGRLGSVTHVVVQGPRAFWCRRPRGLWIDASGCCPAGHCMGPSCCVRLLCHPCLL